MGSGKRDKQRSSVKAKTPQTEVAEAKPLSIEESQISESKYHTIVVVLLLILASYIAVTFYGHQVWPNSDFTAFSHVGRDILSFQMPYSFKRVPLWGMLHVSLGWLMPGQHPEYTAALILNTGFYIGSAVLLYLIAVRLVGKAAPWLTLIAMVNPMTLKFLSDPIVETCFIFFTLASFYLLLRRSRWVYLLAGLTTMVRYEGAGLIFAAFVVDMITAADLRKRLWCLLYAALASIPLGLWLLGTWLTWQPQAGGHYLHSAGISNLNIMDSLDRIWQVSISPLLPLHSIDSNGRAIVQIDSVSALTKAFTIACCLAATIYTCIKRNWTALALVIYTALYIFAHELKAGGNNRYYLPISFAILLLTCIGLQAIWKLRLCLLPRGPRFMSLFAAGLITILSIIIISERLSFCKNFYETMLRNQVESQVQNYCRAQQIPYSQAGVDRIVANELAGNSYFENHLMGVISPKSIVIPIVTVTAAIMLVGIHCVFYRKKDLMTVIAISGFCCLILVSNQFTLAQILGKGEDNIEFKRLVDWYVENSEPGEKLVVEMSDTLAIFAPDRKPDLVHIGRIGGESFNEFIADCHNRSVRYIAWSSRLGLATNNSYYRRYGFARIAALSQPRNYGPCEFITKIDGDRPYRYIYIFRLVPEVQR